LKAGSVFTELDTTPVAVISESLARGLWPGEPLPGIVGRSIREGDVAGELVTITGVVADAQLAGADRELAPQLYRPNQQRAAGKMSVVVRVAGRPEAVVPSVRAAVRAMAPSLPILAIRPVQEIISTSIAQRRFEMLLTSVFAASALLLGIIGVYGMVVYSVNSQTREIGLRMVFGATRGSVLGWVLIRGLRAVIAGMVVGTCATVIAATSLRSLLFGIGPADPLALGAALLAVIYAFTVGNLGFDSLSLMDDLSHGGKREWLYGFLAGGIFNLGNMLLLSSVSVSGMAVAFPGKEGTIGPYNTISVKE